MDEAHKSKYFVHLGADKMYYDLRDRCWWPGMKKDIAVYIKVRLKVVRDRQKSYADKRRKPLEFSVVPLDEIRVDAKLNFVEEHVEILEREFKKLKRSRITIVKVRWNSKRGPEFTWEREDQIKLKYPHLFSADSS
ncbi:putative reverse transcriptase domain-containing protein [Tanacetum coccineum]